MISNPGFFYYLLLILNNKDIEIRKKGLDALESCFFIQQRLPTTVVGIKFIF